MVNIKVTDDKHNNTAEMNGTCVIAFVLDPEDDDADIALLMLGITSPENAVKAVGNGLGSVIRNLLDDEAGRDILAITAVRELAKSVRGETNCVEKEKEIIHCEE